MIVPQSVYSRRTYYTTFDVTAQLLPGANSVGVILGNYKWGYTDIWCNMTASGGPNGCRAAVLRLDVTLKDGRRYTLDTSEPSDWEARPGPVVWDHFFHGETFNAQLGWDWNHNNTGTGTDSKPVASLSSSSLPASLHLQPTLRAYPPVHKPSPTQGARTNLLEIRNCRLWFSE